MANSDNFWTRAFPDRPSLYQQLFDTGNWEESPTYRVTPTEPRPVVVVHGTAGARGNFNRLVPYLRKVYSGRSRRIFSVSYGTYGMDHLNVSLEEIEEQLLALADRIGAKSFDLVAHSQGGLQSLAVASRPAAGHLVHHIVGLAADFRGVRMPWSQLDHERMSKVNRVVEDIVGPAFAQQVAGSAELAEILKEVGRCEVPITQIATKYDRTVPLEAAFALADDNAWTGIPAHPGPLRLVLVQRYYPHLRVAHNMLLRNPKVAGMVKYALEHTPGQG